MNHRPAIVMITSSFPIEGDGSEAAGAFVADLAEEVAKRVPVRVVAPGRAKTQETWRPGVEVFRYKAGSHPLSALRPWRPGDALKTLKILQRGASATERAMQVGPVAHLLAFWALPCGEWARRSAQCHGVSYSVWTLGSDIWTLGKIPFVRGRLRTILRDSSSCWSDGVKLAQDTSEIAERKVDFLPSTRRITQVRHEPMRKHPPYRLMFLGRWHPNKGVDVLMEALHQLTCDDWALVERITVAGGGPLEPYVKAEVAKLQAHGRPVVIRGYMQRREAQEGILAADYLLIPSRIDSIPVVFSDAVKLGCPVVAMPVGDLPYLVSGELSCGFLADQADGAGFSRAIKKALRSAPAVFSSGVGSAAEMFSLEKVSLVVAGLSKTVQDAPLCK